MHYDAILLSPVDMRKVQGALSRIFRVPETDVDIWPSGYFDERNWDARVTCDYEEKRGDVNLYLDIYTTAEAIDPRSSQEFSLLLAKILGSSVIQQVDEPLYGVAKITIPSGETGYVRFDFPYEDEEIHVISGTEVPIPEFPKVGFSRFPEMIKNQPLPKVITDQYFPEEVPGDLGKLYSLSSAWEKLTVRMRTGWPPSGWYPASMYQDDLKARDEWEEICHRLTEETTAGPTKAMALIDRVFMESTVDDSGDSLVRAGEISAEDIASRPWYWRRRPKGIPWIEKDH
ncbi:hypothetical protein VSQ78_13645 [Nocardiopsis alba]|uniref:Uncharacterized protein n=1 Tax=Nocardiopsis alba TaxID=53437 RepID=A0ABV5DVZ8_9ACTN